MFLDAQDVRIQVGNFFGNKDEFCIVSVHITLQVTTYDMFGIHQGSVKASDAFFIRFTQRSTNIFYMEFSLCSPSFL